MCTVLLPPGGYPIAVIKYIISYHCRQQLKTISIFPVVAFAVRQNSRFITSQVQGGSNTTGTDFCVNKPRMSRSYLNHLVQ